MKITVQFESLDEFESHFNASPSLSNTKLDELQATADSLQDALNKLQSTVTTAGGNDVGGKLHKDIKDIDDVADDYDEELYLKVKAAFDKLFKEHPRQEAVIKAGIRQRIGDYKVPKGLSVDAYKMLEAYAYNLTDWMS